MLQQVFIFGVVVPTLITVFLFIGFLICWFKFNMRERLQKAGLFKRSMKKTIQSRQVPPVPAVVTYRHEDTPGGDPPSGGSPSNHPPPPPRQPLHALSQIPRTTQVGNGNIPHSHSSSENIPPDLHDNKTNHERDYYINPMVVHKSTSKYSGDFSKALHQSHSTDHLQNVPYLPAAASPFQQQETFLEEAGSDGQGLIQQVFHFPHSDSSEGYKVGRSLDDDDSSDYGHFVPVSELIKDPKLREHYQKAFIQNSVNEFKGASMSLDNSLVYANSNTQCSHECLDTVGKTGFNINHLDAQKLFVQV